jgi:hypothetical protein
LSSHLLCKSLKIKIYKTIILPVLYECETWSHTLREEHRLMVFELGRFWKEVMVMAYFKVCLRIDGVQAENHT